MQWQSLSALLLTVLIWSSSFAFIKLGLHEVNPYFLALIRAVIAGVFLLGIIVLKGDFKVFKQDLKKYWKKYALLGFVGIALFDIFQNVGISHTFSSLADVLLNTNPLFIVMFSSFFLKENISKDRILGLIMGFIGMCVVMFGGVNFADIFKSQGFFGNVLILLSAITWAIYSILNKRLLNATTPLFLTTSSYLFGALFSLPLLLVSNPEQALTYSNSSWIIILYLGIIASGLTFFLWSFALSKMEASRASIFLFLIPILSIMIGAVFLNENITIYTILGSILVLVGIYITERIK
jgi:drug/metabolite transporter (DMT)-like permease